MRKISPKGYRRFIKRHRVSLITIPLALLISGGILYWANVSTDQRVTEIDATIQTQITADDVKLREILTKKAAEEKARQEAAAQATADAAKTATGASAVAVDSSTCNLSKTHNDPSSIDVVVNKKHCIQPVTFVPNDLIDIGNGFKLSAKAYDNFKAMMAAAKADGEGLSVTSSYRSYSTQVSTYAYWVNTSGKAGADTYSARPGYSEHQTGLAFDVSDEAGKYALSAFNKTSQYQWLIAHAADYGFIQRYQAGKESVTGYVAEEWHYRYVGVPVAKDMQANGIQTLEEYWGISGGDY